MRLLATISALVFISASLAQENPKTQPAPKETPPDRLLYNYLLQECQKHFDARKKEVAALKTPADIKARQEKLKAKFIEALGGLPKKTPLNPQVTGKLDRGDYRIEKVIYESQPDHHVTAILYLPTKGKGPYPGVLVPCGHSANGKAAEPYQRMCISLAKNGFVVLCFDPIGQGERLQLLDKAGKAAIPGSTSEHTMAGVGALLVGKSAATYFIWDGIRSLDYLASRPEVDPKRLGCAGNSGGGTQTAYLMALDDRIVCAAPSCYITSLERLFKTIGPQDAEQNITGQVAFGMDHADFLTMRAPLPTLICTATQDFFDIDGAWDTFREAKLVYGTMGAAHKVSLFEFNDKHGFSKPRRQAVVQWMKRWLQKIDADFVEEDFAVFTDAELQCTKSGQVLTEFKEKTVFDINAELAKELKKQREKWWGENSREKIVKQVEKLIGNPTRLDSAIPAEVFEKDKPQLQKVDIAVHPWFGVPLTAWIINGANPKPNTPFLIYASDQGASEAAGKGGPLKKLAMEGHKGIAVDLPGMGASFPKKATEGMAKYFGQEWKEAFLILDLNRPLLWLRVQNLISLVPNVIVADPKNGKNPIGGKGFHVIAKGSVGPIALHAAVISPDITQVTIEGGLTSWEDVVNTPISLNQLANVVPGALAYYDLPDLAALCAPRPLTIRGAVDAAGHPVSQATLEKVYQKVRDAYQKAGAAKNLVLEAAK